MVSGRFGNQFKQINHLEPERTRTIKNVSRPNIGGGEPLSSSSGAMGVPIDRQTVIKKLYTGDQLHCH